MIQGKLILSLPLVCDVKILSLSLKVAYMLNFRFVFKD
jgi:hypothetical protein